MISQTRDPEGPTARQMTHFMGTHQNRLDAKMRVSVPAPFRTALRAHGTALVMRTSHQYPCIEAWPAPVFESIADALQRLDQFSETQDDLAMSLYAETCTVEPDKEGRVVLTDLFISHAALTESVTFIGLGRGFQIWEPQAGQRRVREARERARAGGFTLPAAAPRIPAAVSA